MNGKDDFELKTRRNDSVFVLNSSSIGLCRAKIGKELDDLHTRTHTHRRKSHVFNKLGEFECEINPFFHVDFILFASKTRPFIVIGQRGKQREKLFTFGHFFFFSLSTRKIRFISLRFAHRFFD